MEETSKILSKSSSVYNGGVKLSTILEGKDGKYYNVDTALIQERFTMSGGPIEYYECSAFPCTREGKWLATEPVATDRMYITPGTGMQESIVSNAKDLHARVLLQTTEYDKNREDNEMKQKDENRHEESIDYLMDAKGLEGCGIEDIYKYAYTNTKEFVQILQKQQEKHPGDKNYDLRNLLNHCSAFDIARDTIRGKPENLFKIKPEIMYNREYVEFVKETAMKKIDDPEFMEKVGNLPITTSQLNSIYEEAISQLAKESRLDKVDLAPSMIDIAREYVKQHDGSIKAQESERINPAKQFISFGMTQMPETFKPVKNSSVIKPTGGIFACEYRPGERGDHSDWEAFCIREGFRVDTLRTGMIFTLSPEARVLTIDSRADVYNLLKKYEIESPSLQNLPSILRSLNISSKTVDFERVAREYDAINVTDNGRFIFDGEIRFGKYSCAAWDVPTLIVCNPDVVQNIEPFIADELDIKAQQELSMYDDYEEDYENGYEKKHEEELREQEGQEEPEEMPKVEDDEQSL